MARKREAGDRNVIDGVTTTRGSRNVFADIGFVDEEKRLAKARLKAATQRAMQHARTGDRVVTADSMDDLFRKLGATK